MKINLFKNIPDSIPEEIIETIISGKNIEVERIISNGQSSPDDFWYNDPRNEFVIVLKGSGTLRFKKDNNLITLLPGDYINIPAHCEHRVEKTDQTQETIWLAVYYS